MDMNVITTLVGSLGFPIVACCVMFKQNSELQKTLTDLTSTLSTMNTRLDDIEQKLED